MQDFKTESGRVHTAQWVIEATKAMPKNAIHARDGGGTVIFTWTFLQAKPHDVVWNQNFGCLGTGLGYAIGAIIAYGGNRPERAHPREPQIQYNHTDLVVATGS